MAKRKKTVQVDNWDAAMDGMFEQLVQDAASKLQNVNVVAGAEENVVLVGVPIPCLFLQYLFQCTVLPLSRITTLIGKEGSCKTAFMLEIMRWHHAVGGMSVYIQNEGKDSPTLRHAVLQWNDAWLKRHTMVETASTREWMTSLSHFLDLAKKHSDEEVGRRMLICFGIDSLTATAAEEMVEKVRQDGFVGRAHPIQALEIANYMRALIKLIRGWPFSVVATNHDKPRLDDYGNEVHHTPGGRSVKFMQTFEVLLEAVSANPVQRSDHSYMEIRFRTLKNSIGPKLRPRVEVPFVWWYDEEGKQHMAWDWGTATVKLLLSFNVSGTKTLYKQIQEVVHIVPKTTTTATCRDLGITEPVPYREVAAALEKDQERMQALRKLLHIQEGRAYDVSKDFSEVLTEESERRTE